MNKQKKYGKTYYGRLRNDAGCHQQHAVNRNDTRDTRYGLTQEEREAIGYIDFHNDGEETDDDE